MIQDERKRKWTPSLEESTTRSAEYRDVSAGNATRITAGSTHELPTTTAVPRSRSRQQLSAPLPEVEIGPEGYNHSSIPVPFALDVKMPSWLTGFQRMLPHESC
jgi:hypothetical protein